MTKTEEYIKERMEFFAGDIEKYSIGENVKNKATNKIVKITNKTRNSIEIKYSRYSQWMTFLDFKKKYGKLTINEKLD